MKNLLPAFTIMILLFSCRNKKCDQIDRKIGWINQKVAVGTWHCNERAKWIENYRTLSDSVKIAYHYNEKVIEQNEQLKEIELLKDSLKILNDQRCRYDL